jgi:hypothetical protein
VTAHLAAGTTWYRVHETRFDPTEFNPRPSHQYYGGGRFDSTVDDNYAFCYLASSPEVAVCEALLRDLPVDDTTGMRLLERARRAGRRITPVVLKSAIDVVSLRSGKEWGAVSQSEWLVHADALRFPQTRHWGHWIRKNEPSAAGFRWISKREPNGTAVILFGDRCPLDILSLDTADRLAGEAGDFDTTEGALWLANLLADYSVFQA